MCCRDIIAPPPDYNMVEWKVILMQGYSSTLITLKDKHLTKNMQSKLHSNQLETWNLKIDRDCIVCLIKTDNLQHIAISKINKECIFFSLYCFLIVLFS